MQEPDKPFEHWEQHFLQAYGCWCQLSALLSSLARTVGRQVRPQLKEILVKGKSSTSPAA